jgi:hypothetical protein
MQEPAYPFLSRAGRILNSGQARSLVLTGMIHDLFYLHAPTGSKEDSKNGDYAPLLSLLTTHWGVPDRILIVYELNGPIRFVGSGDSDKMRDAWLRLRTGLDANQLAIEQMLHGKRIQAELDSMGGEFDSHLRQSIGRPTLALELLRQMCLASRTRIGGKRLLSEGLIVLIEAADLLIPDAEITRLSDADRRRVAICQDWFSDPGFLSSDDSVILLAESRSLLNHRISRLPQVVEVEVTSADESARRHFIEWHRARHAPDGDTAPATSTDDLTRFAAGLSIHALSQLLKGADYEGRGLTRGDIVGKVETFIQGQLGEEVVEFKKPSHRLDDVVGFGRLKEFLRAELIPRFQSTGSDTLSGAAVAGPIGGGKTFIFEAVAAELDMVVLVLKNIRSQWFGQTDVIFERLRRVLAALSKVLIFVDEADTQFGRLDGGAHSTERRLTGKIQAMMSDPQLRGRVIWLLMTARIHRLSPDIRRPGRTGDLIVPVLDPEGKDRDEFIDWIVKPVFSGELGEDGRIRVGDAVKGYSAASFASLRSELIAKARGKTLTFDEIASVANDLIPADIGKTRRYQTLQALLNCTRRSLLPDPETSENKREEWRRELRKLELEGID